MTEAGQSRAPHATRPGFCWTCGWHTDAMTAPADLDPHTKMCRWCRDTWQPATPPPPDPGTRRAPVKRGPLPAGRTEEVM